MKDIDLYKKLKKTGLNPEQEQIITRELDFTREKFFKEFPSNNSNLFQGLYDQNDFSVFYKRQIPMPTYNTDLKTIDDLLEQDKQREKDGFPRRIKIGKLIRPSKDDNGKVVVVPTTTEPKFYHDDSITEDGEGTTGGAGEGDEGEVIGEQQAQPQPGEGEGEGAGKGEGGDHDVSSEAFDLGKILTEKFELPNLKNKGRKRSFTKYTYELTDRNRGFGQVLDKKATLKRIIETNILLGNISENKEFSSEELLINPLDKIYRIFSKEKDFETQAIVFFLRDYSGSMQGKPTEVISTQHLFIYSWLMYQYQNSVETRFILHDTEAKEVPDFYTYHKSMVAGGTKVAPAFQLTNKIIEDEQLLKDYNIYVFHGTDGDDWDNDGKELIEAIKQTLVYANRIGITVAKNSWGAPTGSTTVERNIENSGLLIEKPNLIKLDSMVAEEATEERIIQGIKELVS